LLTINGKDKTMNKDNTIEKRAGFTPGPWIVKYDKQGLPFIGVETDPWTYQGTVATVEQGKDAHLIASAPAMYEVLTELLDTLEVSRGYGFDEEYEKVREVLAKADGRGEA
jgi:hypothetical protein